MVGVGAVFSLFFCFVLFCGEGGSWNISPREIRKPLFDAVATIAAADLATLLIWHQQTYIELARLEYSGHSTSGPFYKDGLA